MTSRRGLSLVVIALAISVTAAACSSANARPKTSPSVTTGIHKIKHVIVIMQENRSFDNYFGTYPGADGIPRRADGSFAVCLPSIHGGCQRPYHNPADVNGGGGHALPQAISSIDHGKMDGFLTTGQTGRRGCPVRQNPVCGANGPVDVMGYHDAREIPNYWTYARRYVLQDHLFAPSLSWSLPNHLFMVSGWAARCATTAPASCKTDLRGYPVKSVSNAVTTGHPAINFSWTDITYLLHKHHVSWRYYVERGTQPDCTDPSEHTCPKVKQGAQTPGIWNPLPLFVDVKHAGQVVNVQPVKSFRTAAAQGNLPSVSWIVPNGLNSEHPPDSIRAGQAWVTGLVNDVMRSPDWSSTAIFVSWDDWGGFYDHAKLPNVDQSGYGIRVPGLVISPYSRRGYIDHQTLSHDAYLKFIEDDFLNGLRLDPKTDGRADPRPTVRENASQLGNLVNDFNFNQKPAAPVILPTRPQPGKASKPG
ncbi:MAG: hypothetical protein JWL83_1523 [Actinomycetia bacterium]|nr:hypothetical protein [Actinomycetes bacterium]